VADYDCSVRPQAVPAPAGGFGPIPAPPLADTGAVYATNRADLDGCSFVNNSNHVIPGEW
jgi:hypothetical protein